MRLTVSCVFDCHRFGLSQGLELSGNRKHPWTADQPLSPVLSSVTLWNKILLKVIFLFNHIVLLAMVIIVVLSAFVHLQHICVLALTECWMCDSITRWHVYHKSVPRYLLYLVPPRYCLDMGSITKSSSSFSLLFWGEKLSTGIGSSRCSPCNPAHAIIK